MKPILMGAIGVEWMGWGALPDLVWVLVRPMRPFWRGAFGGVGLGWGVVVEEGMSRVGGWEDGEWLCDGVVGAVRGWVN